MPSTQYKLFRGLTRTHLTVLGRTPLSLSKATIRIVESADMLCIRDRVASVLYRNKAGQVVVPTRLFADCLLRLADVRPDRASVLPRLFQFHPSTKPRGSTSIFLHYERPWDVSLERVSTNVFKAYPTFKTWGFFVSMLVDERILGMRKALQLINEAGRCVGLGELTPSLGGRCGTFRASFGRGRDLDRVLNMRGWHHRQWKLCW